MALLISSLLEKALNDGHSFKSSAISHHYVGQPPTPRSKREWRRERLKGLIVMLLLVCVMPYLVHFQKIFRNRAGVWRLEKRRAFPNRRGHLGSCKGFDQLGEEE